MHYGGLAAIATGAAYLNLRGHEADGLVVGALAVTANTLFKHAIHVDWAIDRAYGRGAWNGPAARWENKGRLLLATIVRSLVNLGFARVASETSFRSFAFATTATLFTGDSLLSVLFRSIGPGADHPVERTYLQRGFRRLVGAAVGTGAGMLMYSAVNVTDWSGQHETAHRADRGATEWSLRIATVFAVFDAAIAAAEMAVAHHQDYRAEAARWAAIEAPANRVIGRAPPHPAVADPELAGLLRAYAESGSAMNPFHPDEPLRPHGGVSGLSNEDLADMAHHNQVLEVRRLTAPPANPNARMESAAGHASANAAPPRPAAEQ